MTITEDELYELSYAKEPKRSSVVSFHVVATSILLELSFII